MVKSGRAAHRCGTRCQILAKAEQVLLEFRLSRKRGLLAGTDVCRRRRQRSRLPLQDIIGRCLLRCQQCIQLCSLCPRFDLSFELGSARG
jgi:hypothetical protein